MKLLYCPHCNDVKTLQRAGLRYCKCKLSCAKYTKVSNHIVWNGKGSILGLDTKQLREKAAKQMGDPNHLRILDLYMIKPDSNTFTINPLLGTKENRGRK